MRAVVKRTQTSLASRLLIIYAVIFMVVLIVFSFVVTSTVSGILERKITEDLVAEARLVAIALDRNGFDRADDMAAAAGARLTVIRDDGVVLYDSETPAGSMENHADRPEVGTAIVDGVGSDRRTSGTLGDNRLYVAVRSNDSPSVVRLSVTDEQLDADLSRVGRTVVGVAIVVGLAGLALVWTGARRFTRPIVELTELADRVARGDLAPQPPVSSIHELDRLGTSIGRVATDLGRRMAETESERRTLEAVLGALPQGVLLVATDDELVYVNRAATSLLGSTGDSLASVALRAVHRAVAMARQVSEPHVEEAEWGSPVRVLNIMAVAFDAGGRVLVVVMDVSEQRRIEAMRRDFVADASHELKTPVATILASMEALQLALQHDADRAQGFAGQVESAAQRLARIIDDLLDLSRLEAGVKDIAVVDLASLASEQVDLVLGAAAAGGVTLTADLSPAHVRGAASDLTLAIRNLLDNAIRYTDEGGSVALVVRAMGDRARVEVRDTGVGIPSRAHSRVFERFFRVDEARSRATGGTGLGLAIVRHVVERHGGSVTLESELGRGSTFVIDLPRVPESA
ncbi:MAG: ATP-binding protein [Acidimicrobiia bacterium]|nr:ATP-binding protein [Acidimicrobiia bacterium]MDH4307872.1 ATP-binding protein [Acidimicrobiia bacterium]MDH5295473.1 ATP-binding protein [Acidimicrobiia bacterium]